jgi:hypothetical protein
MLPGTGACGNRWCAASAAVRVLFLSATCACGRAAGRQAGRHAQAAASQPAQAIAKQATQHRPASQLAASPCASQPAAAGTYVAAPWAYFKYVACCTRAWLPARLYALARL